MIGLIASAAIVWQVKSSLPPTNEPPLSLDPVIIERERRANLKFDDLFPRRSFFGKTARPQEWSPDERYLAYLWNPYEERGYDLYLFDSKTGKSERLTRPETWSKFDPEVTKAVDQGKTDDAEWKKVERMTDLEYREWRLNKAEETRKRRTPLPSYSGVGEVRFHPNKPELLLTYRGDIYRWTIGESAPTRMTRTRDQESGIRYSKDGSAYIYKRGNGIYRSRFDNPVTEQLNPELPDGLQMTDYQLSPDETRLMVSVQDWQEADRTIQYIQYRDRFAKAVSVKRGVADDEFKVKSRIFLYTLPSMDGTVQGDEKAWEVYAYNGGKEWQEYSISGGENFRSSSSQEIAWSADSKRFVFATWRRIAMEYEIKVADVEKREVKTVYKAKMDGDHDTPGLSNPFFTPDDKEIIAMLDLSGYRHPWVINPTTQTARQLTTGAFDAYPIRITPDGKSLLVTANPVTAPMEDIYRVEVATGKMDRVTERRGMYRTPLFTKSTAKAYATFASWDSPNESVIVQSGKELTLTDSHRGTFNAVNQLRPELFTYQNRHGQTVHGFMFKPKDYKKTDKRPLFIYVYGGPLGKGHSVEVGSFSSTAYLFNMYLASVFGYITVTIDPRGSSGYGNAFGNANWEKPGQAQVEDLTDAVKHFENQYNIDRTKVGINGWSFGGFQTQMCMFTAPDTFTLGIAGAGPTEWQNYNTWYTNGVIGNSPNAKPDDLDKYSLTKVAKHLRSPLLLLHGMEDDNVLFQDTVNVYRKLLQYGKGPLVELALDPTGGHGMGGDIDNRDRHAIYLAFLNKWWGAYLGTAPAPTVKNSK